MPLEWFSICLGNFLIVQQQFLRFFGGALLSAKKLGNDLWLGILLFRIKTWDFLLVKWGRVELNS